MMILNFKMNHHGSWRNGSAVKGLTAPAGDWSSVPSTQLQGLQKHLQICAHTDMQIKILKIGEKKKKRLLQRPLKNGEVQSFHRVFSYLCAQERMHWHPKLLPNLNTPSCSSGPHLEDLIRTPGGPTLGSCSSSPLRLLFPTQSVPGSQLQVALPALEHAPTHSL